MKKTVVSSLLALTAMVVNYSAIAQTTEELNVVTSAVPFLRISPDARAGGMGDVGIATSADANASFWNLAKVPFNRNRMGVGVTYTPWLKDLGVGDVYLASLAGFYKPDDVSAVSLGLRYFSLGQIQFTDFLGNPLQSARPFEFGIDFGYTRKLTEKFSIGVAARYINSSLANGAVVDGSTYKAGTAIAGDISLYKEGNGPNGEGIAWGVVLSNLGSKIGYTNDAINKDYIPANLGIGLSYTTIIDEYNKVTIATDINKLLVPAPPVRTGDNTIDEPALAAYRSKSVINSWFSSFSGGDPLRKLQISLGAEYTYNDQFSVRAGYFYEDRTQGNRKFFSAGVGLKYNVIGINLSYLVPSGSGVLRNPLSNTVRFGLTFDLDGGSSEAGGSNYNFD